jgi:TonB family protein
MILSESEKNRIKGLYGLVTEQEVFNFAVVEEKPIYPGCENKSTEDERFRCFNQNMMKHIGRNFRYPEIAKQMGIQGKVYVSFVINKDGDVQDISIARGVDESLDKEAIYLIGTLPKFTPAKQRGVPVNMQYTVPVNMRVDGSLEMTVEDFRLRNEFFDKIKNQETVSKDSENLIKQADDEEIRKRNEERIRKREEEEKRKEELERLIEEKNKVFSDLKGKTVNLYNDKEQQVIYGRITIGKLRFNPEDSSGGRSSIMIYDGNNFKYEIICLSNPNRLASHITEKGNYVDDFKYNKTFVDEVKKRAGNFCKKPKADFGSIDKSDNSNLA